MSAEPGTLATIFPNSVALPPRDEPVDFRAIPPCGGIYALTDEADRVIIALIAADIRRSARARLAPPKRDDDKPRADLRAVAQRIFWRQSHSPFESALLYLNIARKLWPGDYRERIGIAPAWFASLRLADAHPRWKPTTIAFQGDTIEAGPFARRADCVEFIALLEDLYDLCRYHHILELAPHGQACAYFDMGQCPAPCDGSISMAHYRAMLESSARFATGSFAARLAELESSMNDAARAREYSRAARLQELLTRARAAIGKHRDAARRPDAFRYVVVQRGESMFHVKHFLIAAGAVGNGGETKLADASAHAVLWLEQARALAGAADATLLDATARSEVIWTVTHFLAKGERAAGAFFRADQDATPDNLIATVREKFGDGAPDKAQ